MHCPAHYSLIPRARPLCRPPRPSLLVDAVSANEFAATFHQRAPASNEANNSLKTWRRKGDFPVKNSSCRSLRGLDHPLAFVRSGPADAKCCSALGGGDNFPEVGFKNVAGANRLFFVISNEIDTSAPDA